MGRKYVINYGKLFNVVTIIVGSLCIGYVHGYLTGIGAFLIAFALLPGK